MVWKLGGASRLIWRLSPLGASRAVRSPGDRFNEDQQRAEAPLAAVHSPRVGSPRASTSSSCGTKQGPGGVTPRTTGGGALLGPVEFETQIVPFIKKM